MPASKLILCTILLFAYNFGNAQWMTMDHTPNTHAESLVKYNGHLYMGGPFQYQMHLPGPSMTNMVGISRWDSLSASWDTLGTGTEAGGSIMDMVVYNGKLVVAGGFDSINGMNVHNIAIWDGNSFDSLGHGFDGTTHRVDAVAVYNNELYAGGNFSLSGSVNVQHIAKWNGSSWVNIGDLSGLQVCDLTVYNGYLYACGLKNYGTGITPINFIARYDGSNWDTTFGGLDGYIANSMLVYNNELYVGGGFGLVNWQGGSLSVNSMARWNGSTWDSVGHGAAALVNDMTIYNNNLYVGTAGQMLSAFDNPIAKWNGSVWSTIGIGNEIQAGIGATVTAICAYDDDLFISGTFNYVMNTYCLYLAKFHDTSIHPSSVTNLQTTQVIIPHPNPFTKDISFELSDLQHPGHYTLLINDIIGRNVYRKEFDKKITVNELQQNGHYIWSITENGNILASGIIIKKE